jgi:glucose-1-phosphate thymidylyltransferase
MRGIILAADTGGRRPGTRRPAHPLAPVLDKPMIYYPLATLMTAGIRQVAVIASPTDESPLRRLLGDGTRWGMTIRVLVQPQPQGMAHAVGLAADFVGDGKVALALGDNIFHGPGVGWSLAGHADVRGALVFAYRVRDPGDYGVVELDRDGQVLSVEERPRHPRSDFAVPGLYFYDNAVLGIAAEVAAARSHGTLTAVNEVYRRLGRLRATVLGPETAWLDTGRFDSITAAAEFVRTVEITQGYKIGCVEEVAWRRGWIDDGQLLDLAGQTGRSGYGQYLRMLTGLRRDRTVLELPPQPTAAALRAADRPTARR